MTRAPDRDTDATAMAAEAEPAARPWIRGERWWAIAIAAALIAPILIAIGLTLAGHGQYRPGFDNALMELRVRDVLDHAVFTGPYSRYGWYHPGPLLFYVDAIPYWLSGSNTLALPVTALVLNALALASTVWLAFRVGRLAAVLWVALPTALLLRTLGADFLRSPWNPDVALLMFLVFLLASWSLAIDRRWSIPIMIVTGTFIVQSHVGYGLPVAAIAGVATVLLVLDRRARDLPLRRPGVGRRALLVMALLAALWALPLYGDLVAGNSNLRNVARFALSGGSSTHEPRVGGLAALRTVGAQLGPKPVWIFVERRNLPFHGTFAYSETDWWAPILGVLAVIGVLIALRAKRRVVWSLAWLVGTGLVVAVVSVASTRGIVYAYLTQWTSVLGAGLGVIVVAGLWYVTPARWLRIWRPAILSIVIVVVALVGVTLVRSSVRDRIPSDTISLKTRSQQDLLRAVGPPTIAAIDGTLGPVVLDTTHGVLESPGIALSLERSGIPVRVRGAESAVPYGPDRTWHCGPYRSQVVVLSGDENIAAHRPRWPRVAHWSEDYPAADREHQKYVRLVWSRRPPSALRTQMLKNVAAELNGPKYEVAVFASPPGTQQCRS